MMEKKEEAAEEVEVTVEESSLEPAAGMRSFLMPLLKEPRLYESLEKATRNGSACKFARNDDFAVSLRKTHR